MHRFAAVVDRSGRMDLAAALDRAGRALTAGGTRERRHVAIVPPFGLLLLSHAGTSPLLERAGTLWWPGGDGPPLERTAGFLAECAAAAADPSRRLPAHPQAPRGRRAVAGWNPAAGALALITEPSGLRPVHVHDGPDALVLATEAKAIPAALGRRPAIDPDGLADLWTLNHCAGLRTLVEGVRLAPPGTLLRWAGTHRTSREWPAPVHPQQAGEPDDRIASDLIEALRSAVRSTRERAPRTTLTLSGGLDSRILLALARREWPAIETVTFGDRGSTDARFAADVALRAGAPHVHYAPAPDFFARWARYAVWRADGMMSAMHAQGMDALIAHAGPIGHDLNGFGGDIAMGAFLRPDHLRGASSARRAVSFLLASRRILRRPLARVLKPEWLAARREPTEEVLTSLLRPLDGLRFGDALTAYWTRHYWSRIQAVGVDLEAPWVASHTPLAEPEVQAVAARMTLEQRFHCRVYRRALVRIAPELSGVPWERSGVPPRWPWWMHAAGRYGRRFGLLPRTRHAIDHAASFRGPLAAWLRETLLSERTRRDGVLLPDYLETIVDEHLAGRAVHTAQLSLAVTVELWRRMAIDGDGVPDALPPLPERGGATAAGRPTPPGAAPPAMAGATADVTADAVRLPGGAASGTLPPPPS
jgi:asparagine synthase (glutamine-hydrolysing)